MRAGDVSRETSPAHHPHIAALVFAAVINGVVAVPLLAILLLIANNRGIMGDFTNSRLSNIAGVITFIGMGLAAIVSLVSLLLGG